MHTTAACLRRGFWGRSLEEFQRLSSIVFRSEGIKGPSGPMPLQSFHDHASMDDVKVMSDNDIDGFSKAYLDYIPPVTSSPASTSIIPGHMRFHGSISTRLPENNTQVTRSGYAAFRTLDRPPTIFGRSLWNIDSYSYLGLRIKSDGRSYLVNIQTESVVPEDLHQHRLFARRPGQWETVHIKWNDFVRTNYGYVVEPQTEMLRQKVKSIGIGLTDRIPGPFDLCVERMWATNTPEAEMDADFAAHENPHAHVGAGGPSRIIHDATLAAKNAGAPAPKEDKEGVPAALSGGGVKPLLKNKHGKEVLWS